MSTPAAGVRHHGHLDAPARRRRVHLRRRAVQQTPGSGGGAPCARGEAAGVLGGGGIDEGQGRTHSLPGPTAGPGCFRDVSSERSRRHRRGADSGGMEGQKCGNLGD